MLDDLGNQFKIIENFLQDSKQDFTKKSHTRNPQQLIPPKTSTKNTEKKELSEGDQGYQVIQWLNNQRIKVEKYCSKKESILEEKFYKLAIYLGENYAILDEFHKKLKQSVQDGNELNFSLKTRAEALQGQERTKYFSVNTNFCSMLNNADFLSYDYNKKTKVINGAVHFRIELKNFLSGYYFERFIFHKITKYLKS